MSPFYLPPRFVKVMAVEARHEQESSLSHREWEDGEMCMMGWENVWMRWTKTWFSKIIKYWWTCIGNLQPYIGLLIYPFAFPLTTKKCKSIGWKPMTSTNRTKKCLVGFWCLLQCWLRRLQGLGGLVPMLQFGWEDEVYVHWHSTPTLMIAHKGGAFTPNMLHWL
jgi:hypothetical protein